MRYICILYCIVCISCDNNLPTYDVAADLRILGISLEPPEILTNNIANIDLQSGALVVDPRSNRSDLIYKWRLCPVQSSLACDDFDTQLAQAMPSDRPTLLALRNISMQGVVSATVSNTYNIPMFDVAAASIAIYGQDITSTLVAYYMQQSLLGQGFGVLPSVILSVQNTAGERVVAEKRLVLDLQDIALYANQLSKQFGLNICTSANQSHCLNIAPRTANQNPTIASILSTTNINNSNTLSNNTLVLPTHQQLLIRPVLTPNSIETYQTIQGSLQNDDLQVLTLTEQISISWFCDTGSFLNALTYHQSTGSLDNIYTPPSTVPSENNGIATFWIVARDGRGGESWEQMTVQIIQ